MPERIVRCTIEMDMIEGEHFNPTFKDISDLEASGFAISNFLDVINSLDNMGDLREYVQTKIVESVS